MGHFSESLLNFVTYGLAFGAGLIWVYGMVPKKAESYFRITKRAVEVIAMFVTFMALALAVLSVYLAPVVREPLAVSRYVTAPALILVAATSLIALFVKRDINKMAVLQAIAIWAVTATIFRLYP